VFKERFVFSFGYIGSGTLNLIMHNSLVEGRVSTLDLLAVITGSREVISLAQLKVLGVVVKSALECTKNLGVHLKQ
jgi:hypothetical protein